MSVGPGSLLGGRYQLGRRLHEDDQWERWSGHDGTLERDVVVLTFPSDWSQAGPTLDAARRAAGIEEPRLVRVLDVGVDAGTHFVVEESLSGAESLRQLVHDGGIEAEQARRITGEAASALATAAARGLHHGRLTPHDVQVLPGGAVKVGGLATAAALAGQEDLPAEVASRIDTTALVAILYAALTGRWPLPGSDVGLEPAPRVGGTVAAPSELTAGVGGDLDRLALLVLSAAGDRAAASASDRDLPDRRGVSAADARTTAAHADLAPRDPAHLVALLAPWAGAPSPGTAIRAGAAAELPPSRPVPMRTDPAPRPAPAGEESEDPGRAADRPLDTVGKSVSGALSSVGAVAASVASKVGSLAREAADRAAQHSNERAERRSYAHTDPLTPDGEVAVDTHLSDVLAETDASLGAPAPLIPDELGAPPDSRESRLALALVAGLLVLIAILGIWGLPRLGFGASSSSDNPSRPATTPASSTSTTPRAASPGAAPSSGSSSGTPVAVTASAAFEPSGGGQVASPTAARAFDGDPATLWRSKYYMSADFAGMGVTGLGLIAELGQPTPVSRVVVTLPAAQDVSVYVADHASLSGAQLLGSATGATGTVSFDAPGGAPLTGQLVIVVVTRLGPDGEGHFRAQISEIKVST